jgi:hypothetical protein
LANKTITAPSSLKINVRAFTILCHADGTSVVHEAYPTDLAIDPRITPIMVSSFGKGGKMLLMHWVGFYRPEIVDPLTYGMFLPLFTMMSTEVCLG